MSEDVVLLTTFLNRSKRIRVVFHKNVLIWDYEKPPFEQNNLELKNIISVKPNYLRCTHPSVDPEVDPFSFTIHYGVCTPSGKWKYKNLSLRHTDSLQVTSWIKTLQQQLNDLCQRPKKLLIFINPFGGKKNSMKIYTKFCKPLFETADIDVTVNISQRKDQIRDFLISSSLEMFDSVACVGGDGTVSELFNGLVLRECNEKGIDADDISTPLPNPKMPVGIIPGGSTDTIAYCLYGTTDPTTAVFHIIYGDSIGLDLVSVHNENKLLKLYASVLSYGYLGDVAYNSDRHRWMGPQRYNYSGFKKLLSNKGYDGEVAILTESTDILPRKCYGNCDTCSTGPSEEKIKAEWKTLKGKYFMISGANISCACGHSPNGIAPYSHLGDGNVHLVLVKHGSIINNLRLLLNLADKKKHIEELPFVETYCAKEFCFRSMGSSTSFWNCDGEVQHQSNIRAKVSRQLITIFSRGRTEVEQKEKGCCGG